MLSFKNACVHCVSYKSYVDPYWETYCNNVEKIGWGEKPIPSFIRGEMVNGRHHSCQAARTSEKLCGIKGKYFVKKTMIQKFIDVITF